uniref:RING-type domain-containing protein n=1 Tax=Panagrellus redivivus TaxID=6233 RepID=A0A7E4V5T1_PANRE
MLHGNGKWFITKMLQRIREQKKQREQLRLGALGQTLVPMMETEVPDDLKCFICHGLYKDAVALRCGDSFCGDCIYENVKTAALNNRVCLCPQCQEPVRINDLLSNAVLCKSVDDFKNGPQPSPEVSNSLSSDNTSRASSPSFNTSESAPSKSTTPLPPIEINQPSPTIKTNSGRKKRNFIGVRPFKKFFAFFDRHP